MNSTHRFPFGVAYLLFPCILAFASLAHAQNTVEKVLVGDTKVTVTAAYTGKDRLPPPTNIVLHDFDIPSEIITIDNSPVAHILSNDPIAHMKGDAGENQDPAAVAEKVQAAFSNTLLSDLKKSPVPVTESPLGANPILDGSWHPPALERLP